MDRLFHVFASVLLSACAAAVTTDIYIEATVTILVPEDPVATEQTWSVRPPGIIIHVSV